MSRCADVVDSTNVHGLSALVGDRLQDDELHPARVSVRHRYFDDVAVGESTARFIDAVNDLVASRDALLAAQVAQDPVAGQPPG